MQMLFCNIGWMESYNGVTSSDSITRGGSYNNNNIGHEACNFLPKNGQFFGFVQAINNKINLERIGEHNNNDYIDHVCVIWTATRPISGTVIIGWYKDATVYRNLQKISNPSSIHQKNGITWYNIKALAKYVTLLPIERRIFPIPRNTKGGMGRSNIWYADSRVGKSFQLGISAYISTYNDDINQNVTYQDQDINQEACEGNPIWVQHLSRERSPKLIKEKKEACIKKFGKLSCEVCGFDFHQFYGERGENFCEVHHIKPLAHTNEKVKTRLSDLAIVCSNCHRIIHRTKTIISIDELKRIIEKQQKNES